jgi:hypothetical protein
MTQAVATVIAAISAAVDTAYPVDEIPIVGNVGPTDPPQRLTVLVGSSTVEPPSVACPARVYTVTVWAITPITAPGAGDSSLDGLLDVVLDGLDAAGIVWSDATRGTWADQYPSYEITTEVQ